VSPRDIERRDASRSRAQEIRRRCFEHASNEVGGADLQEEDADPQPGAPPPSGGANFGEAYATMKAEDTVRREAAAQATPREKALQSYRSCVARESRAAP
jgi:hypothetical protein